MVGAFRTGVTVAWITLAAACGGGDTPPPPADPAATGPTLVTAQVTDDPDDPAIWRHPSEPARSLILGTNKVAAPRGALVVFGLDGRIRQTIAGIDRPNNVDVEQGVRFGDRVVDLAVVAERLKRQLRVFLIAPDGSGLTEAGAVPVLAGEREDRAEPMGISLYRRPVDGVLFAIVAPKTGDATNYLWQYRIDMSPAGVFSGRLVRRFGNFSGLGAEPGEPGEIEAEVVDDALGFVYYSDERFAIHKWHADPDHAEAGRELAVFGTEGYQLDREGLGIYANADGTGFLVSTDQIPGGSVFKLYPRQGRPGAPHEHLLVREFHTTADETDGIDVSSSTFPGFPEGMLVAMNSTPRNFAIFDWSRLMSGPAGPGSGAVVTKSLRTPR